MCVLTQFFQNEFDVRIVGVHRFIGCVHLNVRIIGMHVVNAITDDNTIGILGLRPREFDGCARDSPRGKVLRLCRRWKEDRDIQKNVFHHNKLRFNLSSLVIVHNVALRQSIQKMVNFPAKIPISFFHCQVVRFFEYVNTLLRMRIYIYIDIKK